MAVNLVFCAHASMGFKIDFDAYNVSKYKFKIHDQEPDKKIDYLKKSSIVIGLVKLLLLVATVFAYNVNAHMDNDITWTNFVLDALINLCCMALIQSRSQFIFPEDLVAIDFISEKPEVEDHLPKLNEISSRGFYGSFDIREDGGRSPKLSMEHSIEDEGGFYEIPVNQGYNNAVI